MESLHIIARSSNIQLFIYCIPSLITLISISLFLNIAKHNRLPSFAIQVLKCCFHFEGALSSCDCAQLCALRDDLCAAQLMRSCALSMPSVGYPCYFTASLVSRLHYSIFFYPQRDLFDEPIVSTSFRPDERLILLSIALE